jgi:D-glycero-D-manno-heptose 1,7-bisphosphate phosphatase
MSHRAVFLDRDGTLIEDMEWAARPEQIRILGGVARGLARLAAAGYKLVVVTNQSGIARGLLTEEDLNLFHQTLDEQLDLLGARVDVYYTCPHYPDPSQARRQELAIECDCRKPKPGLLLQAAKDLDLDLPNSWMVGDMWRDIQAGKAAGVRTLKVPADAKHDAPRPADVPPPTAEVEDLDEAADVILGADEILPPAPTEPVAAEAEVPEAAPPEEPPPAPLPKTEAGATPVPGSIDERGHSSPPPAAAQNDYFHHGPEKTIAPAESALPAAAPAPVPADGAAAPLLRELVAEVRRLGRARHGGGLSFLRLMAYIVQAGALFCALVPGLLSDDRTLYIQAAIFLQLLVITVLLFERNS